MSAAPVAIEPVATAQESTPAVVDPSSALARLDGSPAPLSGGALPTVPSAGPPLDSLLAPVVQGPIESALLPLLAPVTGPVGGEPGTLIDTISGPVRSALAPSLASAGAVVQDVLGPVLSPAGALVQNMLAPVLSPAGALVQNVLAPVLSPAGALVQNVLAPIGPELPSGLGSMLLGAAPTGLGTLVNPRSGPEDATSGPRAVFPATGPDATGSQVFPAVTGPTYGVVGGHTTGGVTASGSPASASGPAARLASTANVAAASRTDIPTGDRSPFADYTPPSITGPVTPAPTAPRSPAASGGWNNTVTVQLLLLGLLLAGFAFLFLGGARPVKRSLLHGTRLPYLVEQPG